MIQHGVAPFLECSSKGDKRFSAFHARVRQYGNRTIEEIYQGMKVFEDGCTGLGWRDAKGRRAVNQSECAQAYAWLWGWYLHENPELLPMLRAASGLSDVFGREGSCCQATELWSLRNTA